MTGRTRGVLALAWLATRVPMFLMVLGKIHNPWYFMSYDVRAYYHDWARVFATGQFPAHDVQWQYPPGAAAPIWLPRLFGGDYATTFYWLALAADAAILAMLMFVGGRRRSNKLGSWMWVAAVPLLGEIVYYRYDVLVSVFAVAAVLLMARKPITAGIITGLGAIIKLWPGLILFGAPPRHKGGTRAIIAAATTTLLLYTTFTLTMTGANSFLRYQSKRGIEIESIFATPFMIIRHLGVHYDTPLRYGSIEYVGPGVTLVGYLALATTVLALAWMILWRLKTHHWTPATTGDAALVATLLFIVISRVISPQYMIWTLALAAAALCIPGTSQKPTALLLLLTTAITQIEFPMAFGGLVPGHLWGTSVLISRNVLLVITTVVAMRQLWRATVNGPTAPDMAETANGTPDGAPTAQPPNPRSAASPVAAPNTARTAADPIGAADSGTLHVSGQGG